MLRLCVMFSLITIFKFYHMEINLTHPCKISPSTVKVLSRIFLLKRANLLIFSLPNMLLWSSHIKILQIVTECQIEWNYTNYQETCNFLLNLLMRFFFHPCSQEQAQSWRGKYSELVQRCAESIVVEHNKFAQRWTIGLPQFVLQKTGKSRSK